jgi:hypothetical protein
MIKRLWMLMVSLTCFTVLVSRDLRGMAPAPGRAGKASQQEVAASDATPHSSYRMVLDKYCVTCHNQKLKTAGLTLDAIALREVGQKAEVWEKVARKLRTRTMPPAGRPRPDNRAYESFRSWLEAELDRAAVVNPNPGRPTLHRLNRTEYANAIRDLLGLEIDAASLLPPDTEGYGFDNIADVLSSSPALTERYLAAAASISERAVGRLKGSPSPETYFVPTDLDQQGRVSEDLPFGSRGGMAVRYYFPVDGDYSVKIRLHETTAGIRGLTSEPNQLDVRLDGVKVWTSTIGIKKPLVQPKPATDANASKPQQSDDASKRTDGQRALLAASVEAKKVADNLEFRLPVKAGSRLLQLFFVQKTLALLEDLIEPDLRSKSLPNDTSGEPGISSVTITGPYDATSTNDSPSRQRILVCRPTGGDDLSCAKTVITHLTRRAYRRSVTDVDLQDLLDLYREGERRGGFESGIELALRGILVSPEFLFRFEGQPASVAQRSAYQITQQELASRLSFFLWSSIPDDELLEVAAQGKLRNPSVLEHQVRRMLADNRADALVRNFAGQWLHVRNVPGSRPSPELFFDFDDNLRQAFQRETELFFGSILREDRSVLEFLDANFTFVNERLARHYGISGVYGDEFRRIELAPDSVRRGLLGQGSILTVTSYSNRTSPVVRGKWILENLLGTPPPPPPPNVPDLKDGDSSVKILSMRQRMAQHRNNPACSSCHAQMDPLGFALENFDAIGRWRAADESDTTIDAAGTLPDGTKFEGPVGLRKALINHSDDFVVTLVERLLTYALGRGLEYYDGPAVRQIKRQAAHTNYRFESLILGVAQCTPFQMSQGRERGNRGSLSGVSHP